MVCWLVCLHVFFLLVTRTSPKWPMMIVRPFIENLLLMVLLLNIFLVRSSSYHQLIWHISVHLVLHQHWIGPTFLKLGSWSPGAGFYSYYIHQGNKSHKERKIVRKQLCFMHTKRFNTFLKRWVQFCVGGCNSTSTIKSKSFKVFYMENCKRT